MSQISTTPTNRDRFLAGEEFIVGNTYDHSKYKYDTESGCITQYGAYHCAICSKHETYVLICVTILGKSLSSKLYFKHLQF